MPQALDEQAVFGLPGHDRGLAAQVGRGPRAQVEAQVRLARLLVRPVTDEAAVREQRADLAGEVVGFFSGQGGQEQGQARDHWRILLDERDLGDPARGG